MNVPEIVYDVMYEFEIWVLLLLSYNTSYVYIKKCKNNSQFNNTICFLLL